MAVLRVLSNLKMVSGIPDDDVMNVFHVEADPALPGILDLATGWQSFMDSIAPLFPNTVATSGHTIRAYNLADPEPRAPVLDTTFITPSVSAVDPLPSEVALCISYQGVRVSGDPQRRRRGRMYIGPLSTSQLQDGRPHPVTLTDLVTAFEAFYADLASNAIEFGVYSTMDEGLVTLSNGWVDNAFDIQRRRGWAPTSRETFVL